MTLSYGWRRDRRGRYRVVVEDLSDMRVRPSGRRHPNVLARATVRGPEDFVERVARRLLARVFGG